MIRHDLELVEDHSPGAASVSATSARESKIAKSRLEEDALLARPEDAVAVVAADGDGVRSASCIRKTGESQSLSDGKPGRVFHMPDFPSGVRKVANVLLGMESRSEEGGRRDRLRRSVSWSFDVTGNGPAHRSLRPRRPVRIDGRRTGAAGPYAPDDRFALTGDGPAPPVIPPAGTSSPCALPAARGRNTPRAGRPCCSAPPGR